MEEISRIVLLLLHTQVRDNAIFSSNNTHTYVNQKTMVSTQTLLIHHILIFSIATNNMTRKDTLQNTTSCVCPSKPQNILCKFYLNIKSFKNSLFHPDSEAYWNQYLYAALNFSVNTKKNVCKTRGKHKVNLLVIASHIHPEYLHEML